MDFTFTPFSVELIENEPEAAKQYLAKLSKASVGMVPDWSKWTEDEIKAEALRWFEEVEDAQNSSEWLAKMDKLN